MGKRHYIIPVFVPHHGCPFDCIFCNQKKITGQANVLTELEVNERIAQFIATISDPLAQHIEIAFFGGSFTGIEIEQQKKLLSIAANWKEKGYIKTIRVSTRPDYISEEIMSLLIRYGVSTIELGVQSMDDEILKMSCRGHNAMDVIRAVGLIRAHNVQLGLQMMIGLPGDTRDKMYYTADTIIDLKPDFVRIYPTVIIHDTELEKLYLSGRYRPIDLDEAVDICKNLLLRFKVANIPIIRLGLQTTESVAIGKEIVAGPFHPAFRQMVESAVYKDVLDEAFVSEGICNKSMVEVQVHSHYISSLVGQKKSNMEYVRNKYGIGRIRISGNDLLDFGEIKII
ncbi:histone acetyltransferase (RNA polymerase elongator complex component) [Anaerosolibacter carboniphilus]|uniref:Histone acetyltransferase (RNA polymerase elongator complex component) n=1 Tax=Anaerosolibacter carboniphilus TaxID=1417629 RepID=A0A841KWS0_9FIRM|nr:radical SAM protein [Anaerosolibacter carboniphilus]MBB6217807.1 histone acetyltransferase (RNA polymerase elongator complex component) [Anaerosolibacter carboniphilus]